MDVFFHRMEKMMSTTFNPGDAQQAAKEMKAPSEKRTYDERVFLEVESFKLSRTGGPEWAIGHSIVNPSEKVMVRLSTVEERMTDLPKADEGKLRQSYEGENSRESLAQKAQNKVKLIAFDGARPLGVNEEGVKQYRAHWPQTMAAKPEAEVTSGLGSIVLYQPKEGSSMRADAYVEFLRMATAVDASNAMQALESALAIQDDKGQARDPHALVRVFHQGAEVAAARVFPAREKTTIVDAMYGDEKEVMKPLEAAQSVQAFCEGRVTGIASMDANNDLARSVLAGVMGEEEPPRATSMNQDQVDNFFHGAKGGDLEVQIVAVERIRFGMDSAKTYLKQAENRRFADYQIKTECEGKTTSERGYGNTVVAFQRYPNGQPYAIYASPQENLPRVRPLAHFDQQMPLTNILPPDPQAPRKEKSSDNDLGM